MSSWISCRALGPIRQIPAAPPLSVVAQAGAAEEQGGFRAWLEQRPPMIRLGNFRHWSWEKGPRGWGEFFSGLVKWAVHFVWFGPEVWFSETVSSPSSQIPSPSSRFRVQDDEK